MWSVWAASRPRSWLRASPRTRTSSGMMLVARPPSMRPMLAVVSASLRPRGKAAVAPPAAHAHALADERHAGLVVAAEDRGAVGADDVVLDDRLDALAGGDRVHVRAEEERGRAGGARQVRDQVARLAPERRARAVEAHLRP